MKNSSDDKISPIGIKFKNPTDAKMFTVVPSYDGCLEHAYVIDQRAGTIECSQCKKSFDPMWALADLARKESRWMETHDRYKEEMKRLAEREKTTCQHCKQMTRISRN